MDLHYRHVVDEEQMEHPSITSEQREHWPAVR